MPSRRFVFLVLEHRRRQVLHFNVTEHPTADWTSQHIVEAFADRDAPRYFIRDRDGIYGRRSVCGSRHWALKKYSPHPEVPVRIRALNA